MGLYDYRARFYDPLLGRFIQPDSLVPGAGNPLAWDRYAYTLNNPVRYTDPSGYAFLEPHGFSRNKELKLARFEGISLNSSTKNMIEQQTHAVANAYARTYNLNQYNLKRMGEINGYRSVSPELLFFQIHGGAMTYFRVAESCDGNGGGCAAETVSKNRIIRYPMSRRVTSSSILVSSFMNWDMLSTTPLVRQPRMYQSNYFVRLRIMM